MSGTNVKLLKKELVANDTMAFHWERPDGFEFKAGQFGNFALIDPPETDEDGNKRIFSFVNDEDSNELVTTTRLRDSAYKRVLKELPIGSEVVLRGPHGHYTLHTEQDVPAVFLIGGIGITPVHSMIKEALREHTTMQLTLLYANRTPDDAAFQSDFNEWAAGHEQFTFIPVTTKGDTTTKDGETGHIDGDMLKRHVKNIQKPIYYLSGPKAMVQAMYKMLIDLNVSEDHIQTEEYSGY